MKAETAIRLFVVPGVAFAVIAGLLAQVPESPLECAAAGVFLHATAGDIAATASGPGLIATDLLARLASCLPGAR